MKYRSCTVRLSDDAVFREVAAKALAWKPGKNHPFYELIVDDHWHKCEVFAARSTAGEYYLLRSDHTGGLYVIECDPRAERFEALQVTVKLPPTSYHLVGSCPAKLAKDIARWASSHSTAHA